MRRLLFVAVAASACLPPPPSPPSPALPTQAPDAASSPPAKSYPVALTLARGVTCARMSDDAVYCWGNDAGG